MGLARKGSRTIQVDGRAYRWVATGNSGFIGLAVQAASGKGQLLEVILDYQDEHIETPGPGQGLEQRAQVTPGPVRRAIRHALEEGWAPDALRLPPFRLEHPERKIWDD